jgi:DNA-binding transcriptional regulator YhcF (GntR family)
VTYRPRLADVVLDRTSTVPVYAQLAQHIVHLISSGVWPPGTAAASVRQLAADLGLATATAQRVYADLQERGLLVGQAGRGVFVAELAPGAQPSERERTAMLRDLLARAISQARSLGYADDEVLAAVAGLAGALASQPAATVGPPRVVFVGSSDASVEKYVPMLTEMLRPADIELLGVQFSELARDEHLLDAYEPISMIVALIGTFPDLRAVAARHHAPLFGLVVELSDEAQRALIELPSEGQIALIAQQRYLPSARALLRQYFIPDERVRFTTPTNVATVRRLVQASPIIVHTLAAGRIVRELAPPSAHVVEMLYRPNPASVARLRELLAANRSPAGPGRVPVPPATRAEQAGRLAVEAVTIT